MSPTQLVDEVARLQGAEARRENQIVELELAFKRAESYERWAIELDQTMTECHASYQEFIKFFLDVEARWSANPTHYDKTLHEEIRRLEHAWMHTLERCVVLVQKADSLDHKTAFGYELLKAYSDRLSVARMDTDFAPQSIEDEAGKAEAADKEDLIDIDDI